MLLTRLDTLGGLHSGDDVQLDWRRHPHGAYLFAEAVQMVFQFLPLTIMGQLSQLL